MKKLFAIMLGLVAGGLAIPSTAEAGPRHANYSNRHYSCGCAVKVRKVFVGYDCYNRPIYRYQRVPIKHHCNRYRSNHQPRYRRDRYRRDHYQRSRYQNRRNGYYYRGRGYRRGCR